MLSGLCTINRYGTDGHEPLPLVRKASLVGEMKPAPTPASLTRRKTCGLTGTAIEVRALPCK
jgi:hypothetical protein